MEDKKKVDDHKKPATASGKPATDTKAKVDASKKPEDKKKY